MNPVRRWQALGLVRPLDRHLAELLAGSDEAVAAAVALASHATASGHVCADLAAVAGRPPFGDDPEGWCAPPLEQWRARLEACPHVGRPGEARPLVLDAAGRLYLHRYWAYEREIAARLAALARERPDAPQPSWLQARLEAWFGPPPAGDTDWQRVAAATALLRGLCIVSGGPGTGKTHTTARILALAAEHFGPERKVALAAPTGKAAARMQQAVRELRAAGTLPPPLAAALPDSAHTLHRLLGIHPVTGAPRHGPDRPLPHHLVVVDEGSMVDVALMARLLAALPEGARLVLLGDKDQLASVEAGSVLADLCGPAPGPAGPFARRLAEVTGQPVPAGAPDPDGPLRDGIVLLRRNYRFRSDGGIGALARAVHAGDVEGALAQLRAGDPELAWRPDIADAAARRQALAELAPRRFGELIARASAGADPAQVLAAWSAFGILCAHREGPAGAVRVNGLLEAALREAGLIPAHQRWYPGRPVMVVRNDYALRLFNGDVGVAVAVDGGPLRVWFPAPDGGPPRAFAPARLPPHETVFALTVHKSQGSEFEDVLLVLPDAPSRVLTRELLYTGITRARRHAEIWGGEAVVAAAVATPTRRSSGLREALWPAPPAG